MEVGEEGGVVAEVGEAVFVGVPAAGGGEGGGVEDVVEAVATGAAAVLPGPRDIDGFVAVAGAEGIGEMGVDVESELCSVEPGVGLRHEGDDFARAGFGLRGVEVAREDDGLGGGGEPCEQAFLGGELEVDTVGGGAGWDVHRDKGKRAEWGLDKDGRADFRRGQLGGWEEFDWKPGSEGGEPREAHGPGRPIVAARERVRVALGGQEIRKERPAPEGDFLQGDEVGIESGDGGGLFGDGPDAGVQIPSEDSHTVSAGAPVGGEYVGHDILQALPRSGLTCHYRESAPTRGGVVRGNEDLAGDAGTASRGAEPRRGLRLHEKEPRGESRIGTGRVARVVRGFKTAAGWVDFVIAMVVEWWNTRRTPRPAIRDEVLAGVPVEAAEDSAAGYQVYTAVAAPIQRGRPRWFAWSGPLAVLFVALLSVSQVLASSGVASAGSIFPELVSAPVRLLSSAHTPAFVKQAPPRPAAEEAAPLVDAEAEDEEGEPAAADQVAAPPQPVQPPAQSSAGASPAAVVSVRLTEDELRSYALQAGWPEEKLGEVVQVAHCESRYLTSAIGGGALGLMQIMPFWFGVAGVPLAQWADPVTNLSVAKFIHDRQVNHGRDPWGPWACKPKVLAEEPEAVEPASEPPAVPTPATGNSTAAEGNEDVTGESSSEGDEEAE